MLLSIARDATDAAECAAKRIAADCREAVRARGRCVIALSGGETPWRMLAVLRSLDIPWDRLVVTQVDERLVAADDPRRNLARLRALLVEEGPLPAARLLAMPVERVPSRRAAAEFALALREACGTPAILDLVHLGLGADGHTASLLPGDRLLGETGTDVGISGPYEGTRRMSLTYPVLRRARQVLWLVSGAGKRQALRALLEARGDSPAVRLGRGDATLVADLAALDRTS